MSYVTLILQWIGEWMLGYFPAVIVQGVQLKSGPYFNISNLFTKIYNMLY